MDEQNKPDLRRVQSKKAKEEGGGTGLQIETYGAGLDYCQESSASTINKSPQLFQVVTQSSIAQNDGTNQGLNSNNSQSKQRGNVGRVKRQDSPMTNTSNAQSQLSDKNNSKNDGMSSQHTMDFPGNKSLQKQQHYRLDDIRRHSEDVSNTNQLSESTAIQDTTERVQKQMPATIHDSTQGTTGGFAESFQNKNGINTLYNTVNNNKKRSQIENRSLESPEPNYTNESLNDKQKLTYDYVKINRFEHQGTSSPPNQFTKNATPSDGQLSVNASSFAPHQSIKMFTQEPHTKIQNSDLDPSHIETSNDKFEIHDGRNTAVLPKIFLEESPVSPNYTDFQQNTTFNLTASSGLKSFVDKSDFITAQENLSSIHQLTMNYQGQKTLKDQLNQQNRNFDSFGLIDIHKTGSSNQNLESNQSSGHQINMINIAQQLLSNPRKQEKFVSTGQNSNDITYQDLVIEDNSPTVTPNQRESSLDQGEPDFSRDLDANSEIEGDEKIDQLVQKNLKDIQMQQANSKSHKYTDIPNTKASSSPNAKRKSKTISKENKTQVKVEKPMTQTKESHKIAKVISNSSKSKASSINNEQVQSINEIDGAANQSENSNEKIMFDINNDSDIKIDTNSNVTHGKPASSIIPNSASNSNTHLIETPGFPKRIDTTKCGISLDKKRFQIKKKNKSDEETFSEIGTEYDQHLSIHHNSVVIQNNQRQFIQDENVKVSERTNAVENFLNVINNVERCGSIDSQEELFSNRKSVSSSEIMQKKNIKVLDKPTKIKYPQKELSNDHLQYDERSGQKNPKHMKNKHSNQMNIKEENQDHNNQIVNAKYIDLMSKPNLSTNPPQQVQLQIQEQQQKPFSAAKSLVGFLYQNNDGEELSTGVMRRHGGSRNIGGYNRNYVHGSTGKIERNNTQSDIKQFIFEKDQLNINHTINKESEKNEEKMERSNLCIYFNEEGQFRENEEINDQESTPIEPKDSNRMTPHETTENLQYEPSPYSKERTFTFQQKGLENKIGQHNTAHNLKYHRTNTGENSAKSKEFKLKEIKIDSDQDENSQNDNDPMSNQNNYSNSGLQQINIFKQRDTISQKHQKSKENIKLNELEFYDHDVQGQQDCDTGKFGARKTKNYHAGNLFKERNQFNFQSYLPPIQDTTSSNQVNQNGSDQVQMQDNETLDANNGSATANNQQTEQNFGSSLINGPPPEFGDRGSSISKHSHFSSSQIARTVQVQPERMPVIDTELRRSSSNNQNQSKNQVSSNAQKSMNSQNSPNSPQNLRSPHQEHLSEIDVAGEWQHCVSEHIYLIKKNNLLRKEEEARNRQHRIKYQNQSMMSRSSFKTIYSESKAQMRAKMQQGRKKIVVHLRDDDDRKSIKRLPKRRPKLANFHSTTNFPITTQLEEKDQIQSQLKLQPISTDLSKQSPPDFKEDSLLNCNDQIQKIQELEMQFSSEPNIAQLKFNQQKSAMQQFYQQAQQLENLTKGSSKRLTIKSMAMDKGGGASFKVPSGTSFKVPSYQKSSSLQKSTLGDNQSYRPAQLTTEALRDMEDIQEDMNDREEMISKVSKQLSYMQQIKDFDNQKKANHLQIDRNIRQKPASDESERSEKECFKREIGSPAPFSRIKGPGSRIATFSKKNTTFSRYSSLKFKNTKKYAPEEIKTSQPQDLSDNSQLKNQVSEEKSPTYNKTLDKSKAQTALQAGFRISMQRADAFDPQTIGQIDEKEDLDKISQTPSRSVSNSETSDAFKSQQRQTIKDDKMRSFTSKYNATFNSKNASSKFASFSGYNRLIKSPLKPSQYQQFTRDIFRQMSWIKGLMKIEEADMEIPEEDKIEFKFTKPGFNKLVIFDLDETLIHTKRKGDDAVQADDDNFEPQEYICVDDQEGNDVGASFSVRPFAEYCLRQANKYYEVAVFTAGYQEYADPIIDFLDPKGTLIQHRFYHQHTSQLGNEDELILLVKDLSLFKGEVSIDRMLIVDNNIYSFAFNLENGVPIVNFMGDKGDRELLKVVKHLKYMKDFDNQRDQNERVYNLYKTFQQNIEDFIDYYCDESSDESLIDFDDDGITEKVTTEQQDMQSMVSLNNEIRNSHSIGQFQNKMSFSPQNFSSEFMSSQHIFDVSPPVAGTYSPINQKVTNTLIADSLIPGSNSSNQMLIPKAETKNPHSLLSGRKKKKKHHDEILSNDISSEESLTSQDSQNERKKIRGDHRKKIGSNKKFVLSVIPLKESSEYQYANRQQSNNMLQNLNGIEQTRLSNPSYSDASISQLQEKYAPAPSQNVVQQISCLSPQIQESINTHQSKDKIYNPREENKIAQQITFQIKLTTAQQDLKNSEISQNSRQSGNDNQQNDAGQNHRLGQPLGDENENTDSYNESIESGSIGGTSLDLQRKKKRNLQNSQTSNTQQQQVTPSKNAVNQQIDPQALINFPENQPKQQRVYNSDQKVKLSKVQEEEKFSYERIDNDDADSFLQEPEESKDRDGMDAKGNVKGDLPSDSDSIMKDSEYAQDIKNQRQNHKKNEQAQFYVNKEDENHFRQSFKKQFTQVDLIKNNHQTNNLRASDIEASAHRFANTQKELIANITPTLLDNTENKQADMAIDSQIEPSEIDNDVIVATSQMVKQNIMKNMTVTAAANQKNHEFELYVDDASPKVSQNLIQEHEESKVDLKKANKVAKRNTVNNPNKQKNEPDPFQNKIGKKGSQSKPYTQYSAFYDVVPRREEMEVKRIASQQKSKSNLKIGGDLSTLESKNNLHQSISKKSSSIYNNQSTMMPPNWGSRKQELIRRQETLHNANNNMIHNQRTQAKNHRSMPRQFSPEREVKKVNSVIESKKIDRYLDDYLKTIEGYWKSGALMNGLIKNNPSIERFIIDSNQRKNGFNSPVANTTSDKPKLSSNIGSKKFEISTAQKSINFSRATNQMQRFAQNEQLALLNQKNLLSPENVSKLKMKGAMNTTQKPPNPHKLHNLSNIQCPPRPPSKYTGAQSPNISSMIRSNNSFGNSSIENFNQFNYSSTLAQKQHNLTNKFEPYHLATEHSRRDLQNISMPTVPFSPNNSDKGSLKLRAAQQYKSRSFVIPLDEMNVMNSLSELASPVRQNEMLQLRKASKEKIVEQTQHDIDQMNLFYENYYSETNLQRGGKSDFKKLLAQWENRR